MNRKDKLNKNQKSKILVITINEIDQIQYYNNKRLSD